jgi:hypothetical protein
MDSTNKATDESFGLNTAMHEGHYDKYGASKRAEYQAAKDDGEERLLGEKDDGEESLLGEKVLKSLDEFTQSQEYTPVDDDSSDKSRKDQSYIEDKRERHAKEQKALGNANELRKDQSYIEDKRERHAKEQKALGNANELDESIGLNTAMHEGQYDKYGASKWAEYQAAKAAKIGPEEIRKFSKSLEEFMQSHKIPPYKSRKYQSYIEDKRERHAKEQKALGNANELDESIGLNTAMHEAAHYDKYGASKWARYHADKIAREERLLREKVLKSADEFMQSQEYTPVDDDSSDKSDDPEVEAYAAAYKHLATELE